MGFRLPTMSCFTPATLLVYFAAVNVLTYVDRGIVPGALEQFDDYIKDQFHTNDTKELAGVLQSSFIAGYGVASLTFGHLVHTYPPFRLMFLGLCVWMGSIVLSGLAPNYYILVLARVISGVGEASFQTVAPPFIDDNAPADKKALWLSIFFMAIPVGTALGFAYSSIVATNLGWRAAFFLEIPLMVPLALMALFVPKEFAERRAKGAVKSSQPIEYDAVAESGSQEGPGAKLIPAGDDSDDGSELSIWDELRNVTRSPVYLCSVAGYAAYTFVTMGFATFGSNFLLRMHIFPTEEAASITFGLIVALAGAIGTPLGGLLLDRLADPTSQVHKMQTAFRLLSTLMALGFAFCVVGTQMQTRWPMMAFLFVGCISLFATTSMSNVAIMWSVPVESRAFAIGFSTLWMHLLGDVPSPILIGVLADQMAPPSDRAAQPHRLHIVFLIVCLWLLWAVIFYGLGWALSVRMQRSYARMLGDDKVVQECNVTAAWESGSKEGTYSDGEHL